MMIVNKNDKKFRAIEFVLFLDREMFDRTAALALKNNLALTIDPLENLDGIERINHWNEINEAIEEIK